MIAQTLCVLTGQWLNETFAGFDNAIIEGLRQLHISAGVFFDPFFRAVTVLADAGIAMILIAVIMSLFCKTRRCAVACGIGLVIGLVVTNLILKNVIVRQRPYEANPVYMTWFNEVFGRALSDNSFPSGHTTATFAVMIPIFLCFNKKYSWLALVFGVLMGISRIYLVVHYPTDVIVGAIVGGIGGAIGYFSSVLIYNKLSARDNKFTRLVLEEDIITAFRRLRDRRKSEKDESND